MTLKQQHRKAMSYSQEAHLLREKGDEANSIILFEKAFEIEEKVALAYKDTNNEPTRSVLFKSAAALANNCKRFRDSEKMIGHALAGNPPDEIANELRDLYETINFYRHLQLKNIELGDRGMYLSLSGNGVGHGIIHSSEFLTRAQIFEQITYRTAERVLDKPFRKNGQVPSIIKKKFEPYLYTPNAASFAVQISIGKPTNQKELFPNEKYQQIVNEIFDSINCFNLNDDEELRRIINDEVYYVNFKSLVEKLLPDGDKVKQVGITMQRDGNEKIISLRKTKKEVKGKKKASEKPNNKKNIVELKGELKQASAIKNTITIIDLETTERTKIKVPEGLDDIVRMNWGEIVGASIDKKSKENILVDLWKYEEKD